MKKTIFLNPLVLEESRITAISEGFRDLIRIFRSGGRDFIEISVTDAQAIWLFTDFLQTRAHLHYPGWNDAEPGYNPEDEYAFQEVNGGIYAALRNALYDEFPELVDRETKGQNAD